MKKNMNLGYGEQMVANEGGRQNAVQSGGKVKIHTVEKGIGQKIVDNIKAGFGAAAGEIAARPSAASPGPQIKPPKPVDSSTPKKGPKMSKKDMEKDAAGPQGIDYHATGMKKDNSIASGIAAAGGGGNTPVNSGVVSSMGSAFGKKDNPDKKEDAQLGEKIEHDVIRHLKDNKAAEEKEGHKLQIGKKKKLKKSHNEFGQWSDEALLIKGEDQRDDNKDRLEMYNIDLLKFSPGGQWSMAKPTTQKSEDGKKVPKSDTQHDRNVAIDDKMGALHFEGGVLADGHKEIRARGAAKDMIEAGHARPSAPEKKDSDDKKRSEAYQKMVEKKWDVPRKS